MLDLAPYKGAVSHFVKLLLGLPHPCIPMCLCVYVVSFPDNALRAIDQHFEWYSRSLQFLLNFTQGIGALHPDCVSANRAEPWKCLYANETLAHTKAPVFAIQQLSSVWDNQVRARI